MAAALSDYEQRFLLAAHEWKTPKLAWLLSARRLRRLLMYLDVKQARRGNTIHVAKHIDSLARNCALSHGLSSTKPHFVVVPLGFNRPAKLPQALNSELAQAVLGGEVLIADHLPMHSLAAALTLELGEVVLGRVGVNYGEPPARENLMQGLRYCRLCHLDF